VTQQLFCQHATHDMRDFSSIMLQYTTSLFTEQLKIC